jgi:hypothetical protein
VGSLTNSPERYKGFTFRYPGYTSTSVDRLAAENFMRTRASGAKQLLLRPGQHALPLDVATGQFGETEFLLGRNETFTVANARMDRVHGIADDVLLLQLTSPASV